MHIVRNRANQDQPEACNFFSFKESSKPVHRWLFWIVATSCSLILTFAAYELGMIALKVTA